MRARSGPTAAGPHLRAVTLAIAIPAAVKKKWSSGRDALICNKIFLDRLFQNSLLIFMTRVKEFDVEQALDRAVKVFWERGYEGASMRELQEHMGIGRQSIYDTFGDKHELFLSAMKRYDEIGEVDAGIHQLEGFEYLRSFFRHLIDNISSKAGCFLVNTMQEFGDKDIAVRKITSQVDKRIRKKFTRALQSGLEKRELNPGLDLLGAVDFLVAQTYGLSVMAKNGARRPVLERIVSMALNSLGPV